jgi:hypothetical protein
MECSLLNDTLSIRQYSVDEVTSWLVDLLNNLFIYCLWNDWLTGWQI